MTTVLCVPQWQGSASATAPRLMTGARRAAALVPADAVVTVPVLWIDAHPDVYSPQTLPSGAFHGMVVRALLGDGPAGLTPHQPLAPRQVIITGERAGDVSEHEYLAQTGVRRHGVSDLEQALDGLRGPVYVHIDLDVLEPTVFTSTCYPEPDGVQPQRLADLIGHVNDIVGAAITEHAPPSDDINSDEAEVIRRLAAALAL